MLLFLFLLEKNVSDILEAEFLVVILFDIRNLEYKK